MKKQKKSIKNLKKYALAKQQQKAIKGGHNWLNSPSRG